MANKNKKKCTLEFKSGGDLLSALEAAKRWGIPAKRLNRKSGYLMSVPTDKVIVFKGLGSIHFGIEVRA